MIDDELLDMLESPSAETRKQAVMALAKTKSRDALKYLATVYRDDRDPEIRELARKGGLYIKKHLTDAAATRSLPPEDPPARAAANPYDSLYEQAIAEDDYADSPAASTPLPSEIRVSRAEEESARGYVRQALDWHMRGDNERGAQYIRRALRTDPRLVYDSYTIGIAATVMATDGPTAIKMLSPGEDELRKRVAGKEGSANKLTGAQAFVAYVVMIGSAIMLVGYLMFPWLDMSSIPTVLDTGQQTTLGEAIDLLKEEASTMPSTGVDTFDDFLDAVQGLKVTVTGLDSTLIRLGVRDIFDVMGLRAMLRAFVGIFGIFGGDLGANQGEIDAAFAQMDLAVESAAPTPLDYVMPLVPLAAAAAVALSFSLLFSASIGRWALIILCGVVGLAPMAYFYARGADLVIPGQIDLSELIGSVSGAATGSDFISLGFWITVAGSVAVLVLPFIGLLLTPAAHTAAQQAAQQAAQ